MDETQRRQLGTRIKRERKRRGLTQEQLGKLVGLSQRTIGSIERGDRDAEPPNLRAVLAELGMERTQREEWPGEIRLFLEVMGAYLHGLPEVNRLDEIRRMTLQIMHRP